MLVFKCTLCTNAVGNSYHIVRYQDYMEHLVKAMHQSNAKQLWPISKLKEHLPLQEGIFVVTGLPKAMEEKQRLELVAWISEFGFVVEFVYYEKVGSCVVIIQAVGIERRGNCIDRLFGFLQQREYKGMPIQVYKKSKVEPMQWSSIFGIPDTQSQNGATAVAAESKGFKGKRGSVNTKEIDSLKAQQMRPQQQMQPRSMALPMQPRLMNPRSMQLRHVNPRQFQPGQMQGRQMNPRQMQPRPRNTKPRMSNPGWKGKMLEETTTGKDDNQIREVKKAEQTCDTQKSQRAKGDGEEWPEYMNFALYWYNVYNPLV